MTIRKLSQIYITQKSYETTRGSDKIKASEMIFPIRVISDKNGLPLRNPGERPFYNPIPSSTVRNKPVEYPSLNPKGSYCGLPGSEHRIDRASTTGMIWTCCVFQGPGHGSIIARERGFID
jgi:hypothetical protein